MSMSTNKKIKVALADDHVLLRDALTSLINNYDECQVEIQANNGKELIQTIQQGRLPDVAILDLNMPVMDGFETAEWLQKHRPGIHVLMLTMYDSELSLIRLLQAGVKGFLKKDIHPSELKFAINSVMETGYYYSHHATGKLANLFRTNKEGNFNFSNLMLTDQEITFLRHACTDLTYKEIAEEMKLNPRSIDTLRDHLFMKLDVKSRVGLVMTTIKNGLISF
jgi:two-component system invasion response regulator UvrY